MMRVLNPFPLSSDKGGDKDNPLSPEDYEYDDDEDEPEEDEPEEDQRKAA